MVAIKRSMLKEFKEQLVNLDKEGKIAFIREEFDEEQKDIEAVLRRLEKGGLAVNALRGQAS